MSIYPRPRKTVNNFFKGDFIGKNEQTGSLRLPDIIVFPPNDQGIVYYSDTDKKFKSQDDFIFKSDQKYVGIGTTNPYTNLSIRPNNDGAKITLYDNNNESSHTGISTHNGNMNFEIIDPSKSFVFYKQGKHNTTADNEIFRINGDGTCFINKIDIEELTANSITGPTESGTLSFETPLTVASNTNGTKLKLFESGTENTGISVSNNGNLDIELINSGKNFTLYNSNDKVSANEIFKVDGNGNISFKGDVNMSGNRQLNTDYIEMRCRNRNLIFEGENITTSTDYPINFQSDPGGFDHNAAAFCFTASNDSTAVSPGAVINFLSKSSNNSFGELQIRVKETETAKGALKEITTFMNNRIRNNVPIGYFNNGADLTNTSNIIDYPLHLCSTELSTTGSRSGIAFGNNPTNIGTEKPGGTLTYMRTSETGEDVGKFIFKLKNSSGTLEDCMIITPTGLEFPKGFTSSPTTNASFDTASFSGNIIGSSMTISSISSPLLTNLTVNSPISANEDITTSKNIKGDQLKINTIDSDSPNITINKPFALGTNNLTTSGTITTGILTSDSGSITVNKRLALGSQDLTTTGTITTGTISGGTLTSVNTSISCTRPINLGTNNLTTSGTITTGILTSDSGSITVSKPIALGTNNLTTTGTLSANTITAGSTSITISKPIALGTNNLTTSGTITTGTLTSDSTSITVSKPINLGSNALTTSGTVTCGTITTPSGVPDINVIRNINMADKNITASSITSSVLNSQDIVVKEVSGQNDQNILFYNSIRLTDWAFGEKICLYNVTATNMLGFSVSVNQFNSHINSNNDRFVWYRGGRTGPTNATELARLDGNGVLSIRRTDTGEKICLYDIDADNMIGMSNTNSSFNFHISSFAGSVYRWYSGGRNGAINATQIMSLDRVGLLTVNNFTSLSNIWGKYHRVQAETRTLNFDTNTATVATEYPSLIYSSSGTNNIFSGAIAFIQTDGSPELISPGGVIAFVRTGGNSQGQFRFLMKNGTGSLSGHTSTLQISHTGVQFPRGFETQNNTTSTINGSLTIHASTGNLLYLGSSTSKAFNSQGATLYIDRNSGANITVTTYRALASGVSPNTDYGPLTWSYALYTPQRIAAVEFNGFSDERIKTKIEPITYDDALQKLRAIQPKKYEYKDKITRSSSSIYGFAQDIKHILPDAVSYSKEYIPNLYCGCHVSSDGKCFNLIGNQLSADVKIGSEIKLFDKFLNNVFVTVSNILNEFTFEVENPIDVSICDKNEETNEYSIFAYGSMVDDFHILNKDVIYSVLFQGVKELDKEVTTLKTENTQLKQMLETLMTKFNVLETEINNLKK